MRRILLNPGQIAQSILDHSDKVFDDLIRRGNEIVAGSAEADVRAEHGGSLPQGNADVRKTDAERAREYALEQTPPEDDDLITDYRNIRGE